MEVSQLIKQIEFFKKKNIKDKDILELCQVFCFDKIDAGDNVFKWGDAGDKFYIIIKGLCSVQIPNPKIKDWRSQRF